MRHILLILLCTTFLWGAAASPALAFWVWTPETNRWVNPKFSVKDTPKEQFDFAMEFFEAKEYKEAIREFRKLLKNYPRSVEAPDAQYYIAKVFELEGDLMEAYKQYQKVVDRYPFSERSGEIVQQQYDIAVKMLEGEQQRGMLKEFIAGSGPDYNVIEVFRTVIKNAPYGALAAVSQYKIGLYLMEKGMYPEARDEFEKVINDYPTSEWVKPAQYQIAVADSKRSGKPAYDQRVTASAKEEFEEFLEVYPDAELSENAKAEIDRLKEKEAENNFVIAQFYEKQKRFDSAKIYYQIVVDEYPTSKWSSKSLKRIRELNKKN